MIFVVRACLFHVLLVTFVSIEAVSLRAGSFTASSTGARTPPTFPDSYTASYTFTLPYTATFLPQAVSYPVRLWVDKAKKQVRIDTYNGLDTELDLGDQVYMITPRIDKWVCRINGDLPGTAATGSRAPRLLTGGLPSLDNWEYAGDVVYNGLAAAKWTHVHRDELKISQYYFIVSEDGQPMYLHMLGSELVTGAHFDEYEANFTYFQPSLSKADAFDIPELCKGKDVEIVPAGAMRSMSIHFAALIPDAHMVPSEYDNFVTEHGRVHADVTDRAVRSSLYVHHAALIGQHNMNPNATFKMDINKFADWTDDEYRSLLAYRSSRSAEEQGLLKSGVLSFTQAQASSVHRKFKPTSGWMPLPAVVDWRASGAVGPVKDQAVCGSCWSFSATQAMSSAWWLSTGEYISLSEQQVMDCSWDYGTNEACDGGDPDMAMLYVVENGGAYAEESWPYRGEDDFCKTKMNNTYFGAKPRAFFKEIVHLESRDEKAVQEALYRNGPLSIGLDASPVDFRFYSSGVLWSDSCGSGYDSLDHAVLLVGYGTENGQPYWIVKNQWSAHWGDGGYIKIDRRKDCGVTTDAVFPVADPKRLDN